MSERTAEDIIAQRTLARLWYEVERICHGSIPCIFAECPHGVSLPVLLLVIGKVHPPFTEDDFGPPVLPN